MQDNKTRAITKTIRLEKDLHDKIVEMGRSNERDFSAQLRFMLKEYIRIKENN